MASSGQSGAGLIRVINRLQFTRTS